METVAIGTAKSAWNSVAKTVATAITNEIGLLLGVQEELFFIKEELEMMQGFLQVASTEKVKGVVVSIWVKQVQELAFDVEDCLQEASVYLMKTSCLPVMCSVKKRDHIARKIRVLKNRIEDVSKRNLRYNLINKDSGGHTYSESSSTRSIANVQTLLVGLDEPKRKLVELILKEDGEVISVVGMGGLGKTTLVREVYGCQELKDKFKYFAWVTVLHPFNKDEFIESLAKQIPSNDQEVENKRGTVEENKTKSDPLPKKITKEMMEKKVKEYLKDKKYLIALDDLSSVSEWEKIKDVFPPTNGSRIIVTTRYRRPLAESISHPSDNIYEIEKLSENYAFDLFWKAVYKAPNYRLVIDNREMKDDTPHDNKCNMINGSSSTEITEDDCESQKQCITINITMDMKTHADLIIKSCELLPLAIVTVGSYLATKPKTGAEWNKMHEQLSSELANNPDLGAVKTVLTSSYDGMPYHLKPCLLYLSIFHNHKDIRRSRIIRRWMADGYVMEDRKKTAEEVGKGYFNDLMGRNLIQPSQMSTNINEDVKRCNIHDLMYELILAKAMDENIVSLLEDENLITMTDKVRHLVIAGGPCTGDKVVERVKLSHMRSISIFGAVGDYLRYPKMKLVRVLDLEGTLDLDNRNLRSVGKLLHLKYLGLRGTKITELPDSLGKLSELETLDIRNTAIVRLPTGLTKLQKLSYLRAGFDCYKNLNIELMGKADYIYEKYETILDWSLDGMEKNADLIMAFCTLFWCIKCCGLVFYPCFLCLEKIENLYTSKYGSFGVRVPRGIGGLRFLNILGMINIGQSKGLVKELQNLTNLRKLAVTGFSKENGEILAKVIDGLKHLRSLVLEAADDSGLRCCLDSVSSPPKYLQSLKLYSPLGELPHWISSLENLEKIHLRSTELTKEIDTIGKLPNLKILYMLDDSFITDVKELCFGEGTFPKLQVMILERIRGLESVSIEKPALKRLEQLKIMNCRSISKIGVLGLECLVQLKEMEVVVWSHGESDNMFVSNLQKKLPMLPKKPILRVSY